MRILSFIAVLNCLAFADDAVTSGVKKGFADGASGVSGIVIVGVALALLFAFITRNLK